MESNFFLTKWRLFEKQIKVEIDSQKIIFFKRGNWRSFWRWKQYSSMLTDHLMYWKISDRIYISEDQSRNSSLVLKNDNKFKDKNSLLDVDGDLHMSTSTQALLLAKDYMSSIITILKSFGAEQATVRCANGFMKKEYLAYTSKWIFHVHKKEIDSVPFKETAFFVTSKNNNVYFGYHNQINVNITNKEVLKEVHDLCFSSAKRLTVSGNTYKLGWISPEYVTLTDEAVIYKNKTKHMNEMLYLPYDKIDFYQTSFGLFRQRVYIFGEQNILTKHKLSRSAVSIIKKEMKKRNVAEKKGKSFTSSVMFLKNWFWRAPKFIYMDNSFIYFPNRLQKMYEPIESFKNISYSDITRVVWYKPSFALYGTLEININICNLRRDQNNDSFSLLIPQLWAFKFKYFLFKGRFYKHLKENGLANYKREHCSYQKKTGCKC